MHKLIALSLVNLLSNGVIQAAGYTLKLSHFCTATSVVIKGFKSRSNSLKNIASGTLIVFQLGHTISKFPKKHLIVVPESLITKPEKILLLGS